MKKDPPNLERYDAGPLVLLYSSRVRLAGIVVAGLLHSNCRAMHAASTYVAVMKAVQFRPDLVLIDAGDGAAKGLAIVPALAKSVRTHRIAVLLAVPASPGVALDTLVQECLGTEARIRTRALAVIRYPFTLAAMIAKVKDVLEHGASSDAGPRVP